MEDNLNNTANGAHEFFDLKNLKNPRFNKPYNFHDNIKVIDFVCVDPVGYGRAVDYHKQAVNTINGLINQYEIVFGRKIDSGEYQALIFKDLNTLKRSYAEVIEEKLRSITSPSLRELDKIAYNKDGVDFFKAISSTQLMYGTNSGFLDIGRIRFVDGRATFDDNDAKKLLEEEYSIDFGKPEYLDFKLYFSQLKNSYDRLCQHLTKNRNTMRINPLFETIIRHDDDGLISIDPMTKEMRLNILHLHKRTWID